jgi:hypothetical protein
MKWTVTLSTLCLLLAGCEATGDVGGTKTFSANDVPFTFQLPSDFSEETVDVANSRGTVLAAAGLSKVDVIAVRRSGAPVDGLQRHETLGHQVTSELHPVERFPGYTLECQYSDEYEDDVRSACRGALESVERK